MIEYNWVCNQCQYVNKSGTDSCIKCGCSAYANPDEIQARKKPEEFRLKELKKHIESKSIFFLIGPSCILIFFYNGQAFYLVLWLVSLVVSVILDMEYVSFAWKDSWAKKSIFVNSACLFSLFIIRLTLQDTVLEGYVVFPLVIYIVFTFLYLTKSGASKRFVVRYQKFKGNKVMNRTL